MSRLPLTFHRLAIAGSAAASFILASCSDSPSSPREIAPGVSSLNQSPELADATGRHVFHTKEWFANDNAQNPNGNGRPGGVGGGGGTGISYHGGPVLLNGTNVAAVYWGGSTIFTGGPTPGTKGTGGQDGSVIGHFLRNLGGSPYFNINSSYTNGTTHIANSVTYTQFWANSSSPNASNVTDADMVAMLQSGFDSGNLTYDASTVYAIFTGKGVNLGGGFSSTNLQYCAYHTHGTVTVGGSSVTVLYAAMPYDYQFPGSCTGSTSATTANGDPGADYEVNTLAHEIEETTTDMMANAWFDNRGMENADKCAWSWGTTYKAANGATVNMNLGGKDFLVQRNWVNAGSGGCALKY